MAETHNELENNSDINLSHTLEDLQLEKRLSTCVIKISNDNEKVVYKPPPPFSIKCYFHDDFDTRLKRVILGRTLPLSSLSENFDCFDVSYTEKPNLDCKHIHFRCLTHEDRVNNLSNGNGLISGPTLGGRRILLKVKQHYRDQKWLKKSNTMQLPIKSKLNNWVVQSYVSKCFDEEKRQLLNFIKFLDTQYSI